MGSLCGGAWYQPKIIAASQGIPLSYVNRDNNAPDQTDSNFNFKLKFQTQTWTSKTKIFSVLPSNPGLWKNDFLGKSNESNKSMIWLTGEAMSFSRGGMKGF